MSGIGHQIRIFGVCATLILFLVGITYIMFFKMYEYLILHIYKILINFIDNNYHLIHNILHMNVYKFKSRWDVVKAFLNYYKPYKGLFFIDFGSAIVVGLLELIFPLITSIYIDRCLLPNRWILLVIFGLFLLVVFAMHSVFSFVLPIWGIKLGTIIDRVLLND